MIFSPDLRTFKRLSRRGNLVAVSCTVPADLETPVSAYLKLARDARHSFLFESAEQGERIGRYSFIGLTPQAIIRARENLVWIERASSKKISYLKNVPTLQVLEEMLSGFHLENAETLPEFCGGLVGYLGYENVKDFERVSLRTKPGPKVPDAIFFLTREFLIFDHFRKLMTLVVIQNTYEVNRLEHLHQEAVRKLKLYLEKLKKPLPKSLGQTPKTRFTANMSRSSFCKKVRRIKEYVRAGDCIQVVLSQRLRMNATKNDFPIYRALRSINPSPYMFYFRSGDVRLIGSSPEMLVKKSGRKAEIRPIAGTRPRGKTDEEDQNLAENLKRSRKEMAEHLMLVDLGRNDLGRVSSFRTVHVNHFARIERYSHVMHLVSDVAGTLKPRKTSFDLLKAVFPAGTVTGAPKVRAMEIIEELEPETRGPYAGCVGYFSFKHDMDMCITIRTLVSDGKNLYIQAGAGIVQDSHPEKEFQETLNKANALVKAVSRQGEF